MRFRAPAVFFFYLLSAVAQSEVPGGTAVEDYILDHCADCHGGGIEKGGLDLEELLEGEARGDKARWEHALLRVHTGQMPPPKKKRPPTAETTAFQAELEKWLATEAATRPDPGYVPALRRLTRTEYRHAVRDLLGLDINVAELLPKDESSHGFDHITVSALSPTLIDRYLKAAQKIARQYLAGVGEGELIVHRVPADLSQDKRLPGFPHGTRGGGKVTFEVKKAGTYQVFLRLTRDRNEEIEGLWGQHRVYVLVDGKVAQEFDVTRPKDRDFSKVDQALTASIDLEPGTHTIIGTFQKKPNSLLTTNREPYHAQFNYHRHPRQAPALFQISVSAPESTLPAAAPPSFDESDLPGLLQRAFRRPPTTTELTRTRGRFHSEGPESALASILVSPQFFLKIERQPEQETQLHHRLSPYELASRLSFFLWASIPDEELLAAAKRDTLGSPEGISEQVTRLLADPRARALVTNFATQWLHLRNLDATNPDLRLFADFDENLRRSMRRETELFLQDILLQDRPLVNLLQANYTYLDERLATHYGLSDVRGSHFRKVTLPAEAKRGGLLRHASLLTVTSYPTRTSPTLRGNFILENLLGTPAPPPPPNIPSLEEVKVDATLPIRERLASHSENAACAACHQLMDPVGFSLEDYDAVGRLRIRDIDNKGGLPSGETFDGVDGLEAGLARRPELLARAVTEKLLVYALGRGLIPEDQVVIREVVRNAAPDYHFRQLATGIATSFPFTHRKSAP